MNKNRSFMKILGNNRDNLEPCGTPEKKYLKRNSQYH